ncbi:hypothetical protein MNBD_NITROSPINAE03-1323 [hydrothermal vent metagenome]|uniref:DUF4340 domain-containing protein n=1 Tax=hydrothermal vent metagenome TaxID=652676 RepID=A0A3B1CF43_9ZZZZ
MKPGRIYIASALLLLLYGAYAYYDMVIVKEREAARQAESFLLSIEPEKIIKIAVNTGQSSFVLQKKDGVWSVTDPVEAEADIDKVNDIINMAKDLTGERKISGGDAIKLPEYGLDKPATVLFYEEGEGEPQKIIVGDKNPAGSERYVMTGSGHQVYLVSNWKADSIIPILFEVREKRLFKGETEAVTGFKFRAGNFKVSAQKDKNNSWRLTSPVETGADDRAVNGLLGKFVSAKASGFIEEKAASPGKYGLDKPAMEFEADFGKNDKQKLLIGAVTDDGNRYAMMSGGEKIVRIAGGAFAGLPDSVNALRDLAVIKIEPEDVKELSVTFDGDTVKLVSTNANGGEKKWLITEPVKTDADRVAVDGLLSDLVNLKAKRFAYEGDRLDPALFGLNNPALKISLLAGANTTTLKFGIVSVKKPRFYVQVDARPEALEVGAEAYKNAAKTLFDLRDKRLFKTAAEDVGKVVIKRLNQVFEVVKSGDDYRLVSPENIRLTPNQWNRLVWTITGLKYERLYKPSVKLENKKAGDDKPALEITLYGASGSLLESLIVGSRDEDKGGFYARDGGEKGFKYNIDEKFVTKDIIGVLENLLGRE